MHNKKQTLSTLETVFVVMIVVNAAFSHGHAVDPAHARAAAVFRLAIVSVGVIGWIVVAILKRRLPPDPQFVAAPATSVFPGAGVVSRDGVLSVTYNSSRADQWRCLWYGILHRWQTTALVYLSPLLFCLAQWTKWMAAGVFAALVFVALAFAGWTALMGLIFWLQIVQRLPHRDSLRLCTTSLTPYGLQDVVPEKTMTYDWKSISSIRESGGDIFFAVGAANGNFVPRTAFRDRAEAQDYCRAAQAMWKGQGFAWTRESVPDHATWPPPPQVW